MKKIGKKISSRINKSSVWVVGSLGVFISEMASAAASSALTIGGMASSMTQSFTAIGKFLMGLSYVVGIALILSGLAKLKAHSQTPTNNPLGAGIVLVLLGAALLFLPTLLGVAGYSLFGSSGGSTAGPTGMTFGS